VIKPAVLGGIATSLRVAARLGCLGIEIVVTGILDSAAGLWATAQVAAAVGSPLAHGLATGSWIAQDLGPPPVPRMGRLHLPDCPGSGFEQFASE
jgi:L-alanine-DL-glutamate epimerase-like enolase superfamily enzyme